jgi:uncharacterized protein
MPSDAEMAEILRACRVVAVIGLSPEPDRPSHMVARFLQARGKRIVPVNPGQAGREILGETVFARIEDVPPGLGVDMIDLFRRSEHVGPILRAALATQPGLRTVWMQIGVHDPVAAIDAELAGCRVVMDLCPKIEWARLGLGAAS